LSHPQPASDRFNERGFTRAEVTFERQQLSRLELTSECFAFSLELVLRQ
jgi:hypothetical protein